MNIFAKIRWFGLLGILAIAVLFCFLRCLKLISFNLEKFAIGVIMIYIIWAIWGFFSIWFFEDKNK